MAFHDDVDDANDANDETSSEHEFELPFPPTAAGKKPSADSTDDLNDDGRIDLSEASSDRVIDLDAALNGELPAPVSERDDSAAAPSGASSPAPFDLNEEFERSDIADALDQGMPPWAMAPAPDPSQAVPQLDAPESAETSDASGHESGLTGSSSDPTSGSGHASVDDEDDPYQIPADYTTPDFFASRISRRRTPAEAEAENAAAEAADLAAREAESQRSADTPVAAVSNDEAFDLTEAAVDDKEFNFDSLFATQEPAAAPRPPASADDFDDSMWADASPELSDNASTPDAAESDAPANHIWKLGPLEPEAAASPAAPEPAAPEPAAPSEISGDAEEASPAEVAANGAPLWNLDGEDAHSTAEAASPENGTAESFQNDNGAENTPADDDAVQPAPAEEVGSTPPISAWSLGEQNVASASDSDEQTPVADEASPADASAEFESAFAPRQSFVAPPVQEPTAHSESPSASDEAPAERDDSAPAEPVTSSFAPQNPAAEEPTDADADADADIENAPAPESAQNISPSELPSADAAPEAEAETSVPTSNTDVPTPPTRRSMADEELLTWADNPENQSTGTLSVIEVLEAQLRLREEEAREYREWETTFRSRGGPVADEVIDQVRSEFADVVDDDRPTAARNAAAASARAADEPSAANPEVTSEATSADSSAPAAQTPPEVAGDPSQAPAPQLPAWDVPPPSESWSPPADFEDEIPFAAHADPTGSITLPATTESEDSAAVPAESKSVATGPVASLASEEAVPAPEATSEDAPVSAVESSAGEETSHDLAAGSEAEASAPAEQSVSAPMLDPSSGLLSLEPELPAGGPESGLTAPVVDDSSTGQDALADSGAAAPATGQVSPELPADEEGDYDELPFAPPPLVEPDVAPSIPRANLDEHVSFGDFGFAPPPTDAPAAEAPKSTSDETAEAPFAFDLSAQTEPSEPITLAAEDAVFAASGDVDSEQAPTEATAAAEPAGSAPEVSPQDGPNAAPAFNFASTENPRYVPSATVDFDDLLKTDDLNGADVDADEPEADPLVALLANAAPPLQADPLSEVHTGSIAVNQETFETDVDDVVDESDRLTYSTDLSSRLSEDSAAKNSSNDDEIPFAGGVASAAAIGGAATAASLASQPAPVDAAVPLPAPPAVSGASPATSERTVPQPVAHSAAVLSQQPLGLDEVAPVAQKVFSLEESGLEPTPVDRRIGHAARLFWLWFAANSSIVSLGLGAAVFAVGMSLRQSIVAILAGVALSFIPLGLTTLAGKRSGQPTMVVSRASFGVLGNIAPSVVALIARLFWGAVLLWVLASSVAIVLVGSDLNGGLGDRQLLLIALALSFLLALVIAFAGYPLFARIQLILSIISGVLVVGLISFTAQYIDISQALTTPDGSWLLTITGAVLVFSFLGLVWAYSGADVARYQRPSSSGGASMLSATFGAALPAFALIAYGALLAASDPAIARGFLASPLDTLMLLLPSWYPIPLLLAATLSLLSGITLSLYSGGFALQAIGVRVPRQWSIVIVAVLLGALAVLFAFGVNGGINELFRDVATTLAVPTAAWAGIFASETMIRTRKLDSAALLSRGGVYADVRWGNLSAFIVISVIGFALTSATISWLSWQGYGFTALGIELTSELAGTDLGVLVALGLGLLTPLVAGIPAIRRQEADHAERAPRPA